MFLGGQSSWDVRMQFPAVVPQRHATYIQVAAQPRPTRPDSEAIGDLVWQKFVRQNHEARSTVDNFGLMASRLV
jgi:hypothetical protein